MASRLYVGDVRCGGGGTRYVDVEIGGVYPQGAGHRAVDAFDLRGIFASGTGGDFGTDRSGGN